MPSVGRRRLSGGRNPFLVKRPGSRCLQCNPAVTLRMYRRLAGAYALDKRTRQGTRKQGLRVSCARSAMPMNRGSVSMASVGEPLSIRPASGAPRNGATALHALGAILASPDLLTVSSTSSIACRLAQRLDGPSSTLPSPFSASSAPAKACCSSSSRSDAAQRPKPASARRQVERRQQAAAGGGGSRGGDASRLSSLSKALL